MTNWTNPWQQPESQQPYQSSIGQPPPPSAQPPMGQPPLPSPQPPMGQQQQQYQQATMANPLSYQPPIDQQQYQQPTMTNPLPSYPPPVGPQQQAYQQPTMANSQPFYQAASDQLSLRKRYSPEQIRLYFHPFTDRGPKIREIKQKLGNLYKQIWGLAFGGLILVGLLTGANKQEGISYIGLVELAGIIGIIAFTIQLVRTKVLPLREELRQELATEAKEKEYTRTIQPPNERQYDEWISAISNDIYDKAPEALHLREHPEHIAWRNGQLYMPQSEEPEKHGASLRLEGRIASSDEADEKPPQMQKRTRGSSQRVRHYSVYVFTALFITEDYVAIYTNTVNLRDSAREREEFQYCYHQHLSHMSLNVDTISSDTDLLQPEEQIALKECDLSLSFDSGRVIRRNVSTLHIGNQYITSGIAKIHEKLTSALIDHERSVIRSLDEAEKNRG